MRRTPFAFALVAACGSGSGQQPPDASATIDARVIVIDARPPDAPPAPPDAAFSCDPTAQDCPVPSDKCTIVGVGTMNVPGCVAVTGAMAEGDMCMRTIEGIGHDDCAKGFLCTFIDVVPPSAGGSRLCRRLCRADTDCAPGDRCAAFDSHVPTDGVCTPTCAAFSPCPSAMTCSDLYSDAANPFDVFLVCRLAGPMAIGAACMISEDCVDDAVCVDPSLGTDRHCFALCDPTHACTTGACQTFGAGGTGICR